MAEPPPSCDDVRALASELALGTLEGPERGAALAHLDQCPTCRAEVDELAAAVDAILVAAPEAEPPAGFETTVLTRLATEQRRAAAAPAPRRHVRTFALAAAACLLAGIGLGLALGRADVGGTPSGELAAAPMITPEGDPIGQAVRSGGDDAVVFVAVPDWSAPSDEEVGEPFTLRVELDNGDTVDRQTLALDPDGHSWAGATGLAGEDIAAVSLVDADGNVWCTGRFA